MNFATRLKAPAIFVTGFVDQITPPTSVYAAYNQVRSPKEMIDAVSSPHRLEGVHLEKVRERMIRHARTGE
jgi:cephalosporin-C deacetylase-like acetyl esterase